MVHENENEIKATLTHSQAQRQEAISSNKMALACRTRRLHNRVTAVLAYAAVAVLLLTTETRAFSRTTTATGQIKYQIRSPTAFASLLPPLFAQASEMDDIDRLKARAALELEKAKAKLRAAESKETAARVSAATTTKRTSPANAPFFASLDESNVKRQQVTKSVDQATGLITTDGEKMAQLSESEQWEKRGLLDVFENENKDSGSTRQLADRDVAASIYNLRKQLQTEDFSKIFDKRNRFIGETE